MRSSRKELLRLQNEHLPFVVRDGWRGGENGPNRFFPIRRRTAAFAVLRDRNVLPFPGIGKVCLSGIRKYCRSPGRKSVAPPVGNVRAEMRCAAGQKSVASPPVRKALCAVGRKCPGQKCAAHLVGRVLARRSEKSCLAAGRKCPGQKCAAHLAGRVLARRSEKCCLAAGQKSVDSPPPGTLNPRCSHASGVASRPRGVRFKNPSLIRNGS